MRFLGVFALAVVLFVPAASGLWRSGRPAWVKKYPVRTGYYIGIGTAEKNSGSGDYKEIAKKAALSSLISEISIEITSDAISVIAERSGVSTVDVRSEVRSKTRAHLEGHELVDTWENKKEYWVYYRLSKSVYERIMREKRQKAIGLALGYFKTAKKKEKTGGVVDALSFYLQALKILENYLATPLKTKLNGKNILLGNEIHESLQTLLREIRLDKIRARSRVKYGKVVNMPLRFRAVHSSGRPIGKLPFRCRFRQGRGRLVENSMTDRKGMAECRLVKVSSADPVQTVEARFAGLDDLLASSSPVLGGLLRNLSVPEIEFRLNVSPLKVFIYVTENNFGEKLPAPQLKPLIQASLADLGISFVSRKAESDWYVKVVAASTKGPEVMGLYTAFVNVGITVVEMSSGNEIYAGAIPASKGVQFDYRRAGLVGFQNATTSVKRSLLPKIRELVVR